MGPSEAEQHVQARQQHRGRRTSAAQQTQTTMHPRLVHMLCCIKLTRDLAAAWRWQPSPRAQNEVSAHRLLTKGHNSAPTRAPAVAIGIWMKRPPQHAAWRPRQSSGRCTRV